jgi:threonine dehydrogenase-like Zn-dependent dehydrogenase
MRPTISGKNNILAAGVSEVRELRQLRQENMRLKRRGANLNVDRQIRRRPQESCMFWYASPINFPKLAIGDGRCEHGVILKVACTNFCGSDQHMVRGRNTAPHGLILAHEINSEGIETGRDVEFIKLGDLCSVPFNIARCCRNCSAPSGHLFER